MQLRTGHFPLNFYLHRIGKTDSDKCTKCNEDPENIQVTETINHFLFDCQAFDIARQALTAKIGRNYLSLSKIMKSTDKMKALVTYINRTGRLKDN